MIGWRLIRNGSLGSAGGRIVETEAYVLNDPASHAFRGISARNAAMFGEPFHAYVYRIYGRHWCVNVTSETHGHGAAVLIRALEPEAGIELMRARRGREDLRLLCSGPARLCQALDIDRGLDGANLLDGPDLRLLPPEWPASKIGVSRRIGISAAAHRRLRFYERGNEYVSGPKKLSP